MKTIIAATTFIVFGCIPAFSQMPDTLKVVNKAPHLEGLILKPHSDSLNVRVLVPDSVYSQPLGNLNGPRNMNDVQPVPMPNTKPDSRLNFAMPVAKPDSTVDFKLRIKKIGKPTR